MNDRHESRATTHADVCWSWGPGHYECAVGQVKRDEALLRQSLKRYTHIRQRGDKYEGWRVMAEKNPDRSRGEG